MSHLPQSTRHFPSPTAFPRYSITAVILTHNVESQIANCLETIRWCDEVVVVDNNSTDATPDIAANWGARVVSFTSPNFAQKRELGLKYVKTDWVFYLDADERVTPTLYREIAVHLETNDAPALRMKRQNVCYGYELRLGGWENDYVTRIFRREALHGWEGEIHESPKFVGQAITLHSPLIHFTHRSTHDNLIKSAQWTKLEAKLLYEAGIPRVTFLTLVRKGVMEFWRRAVRRRGYVDGLPGLIEALVQALNRVLVYIQVWEFQQEPSLPDRYQQWEKQIVEEWKKKS